VSDQYEIVCRAADDQAEWHRQRKTGIGASEAAVLLGASPWKAPLQLYAEKTGTVEPPDLSDSELVYWGTRLEGVVVEVYAERSARFVDKGGLLLRSTRYPWALATLDAWTATAELGPYWPLEIKTTGAHKGEEWVDGPPELYRLQVAWQMLVTGCERATIACLIGGQKLVWCDVERDDVLERKLIHHGEAFWRRVRALEPPAPDGSESSKRALHDMYPRDTGEALVLPAVLIDVADELEDCKAQEKAIAVRKTEAENTLKLALGAATRGALPDGTVLEWKAQTRKAHAVAETTSRVLRVKRPKQAKGA
jgi:putative phage-type endonuclease